MKIYFIPEDEDEIYEILDEDEDDLLEDEEDEEEAWYRWIDEMQNVVAKDLLDQVY